jgi:hypothetical protein
MCEEMTNSAVTQLAQQTRPGFSTTAKIRNCCREGDSAFALHRYFELPGSSFVILA